MVFFGTGDQEHPTDTTVINQIYAIKDRGGKSPLSISNLENVTNGVTNMQSLDGKEGWFINLDSNRGEKVMCPPVVLFGVAYFTTFAPTQPGNEGIARIYALDYKNGNPILNLNPENDKGGVKIDLSDRSKVIGTGIPSSTTISVIKGKLIAYTGIEGGVYNTLLRKNSPIVPIWWKETRK
jgi:type IV pilus assembly protein PilY1